MIVAGIGCRRGAPAVAIEVAIGAALAECGLERAAIDALATTVDKADEPGLRRVADDWSLPLIVVSLDDQRRASAGALTTSARVQALKGVPSVAETAALAAAGVGARLLCARVTRVQAVCAIAISDGPAPARPGDAT